MVRFGYAGRILRIDLSKREIGYIATAGYNDRFLGGRGIAAKLYWDETSPETGALDPGNCLIFITGPAAGFTRLAGCRWQICGKSPEMYPEAFSYANLGGSWGAWLKFAGYDGILVTGRAESPVYLYVDRQKVEIREAAHLWGKTTIETEDALLSEHGRDTRILEIGPAAENGVVFATILASDNSSGASGLGAVMGSKKLKAIVVKAEEKIRPAAADPSRLEDLTRQVYQLRTRNYENYGHETPSTGRLFACYGCISGCDRAMYEMNGKRYKSFCQSSAVYAGPAAKYFGESPERAEVSRLATRLCDAYGLDTVVLAPLIEWLTNAHAAGLLNDSDTGIPLSRAGSAEFIETLVKKISYREGFGNILADGIERAIQYIGQGSEKCLETGLTRAGEAGDYDPRLILANAMIYATEPRRAIQLLHATALPLKRWVNWIEGWKDAFLTSDVLRGIAERFWGSRDALDFTSPAGKALASARIQDYGYVKESLILCDLSWPIYPVQPPDDSIGPGTLESRIVSAITGLDLDEKELLKIGERIFNLQRAILVRQGWRGRSEDNLKGYLFRDPITWTFFNPDLLVPDKDGKPVSLKGSVMDMASFERIKDEYYTLRGWDVKSGLQTRTTLRNLGLEDIAGSLSELDLLGDSS